MSKVIIYVENLCAGKLLSIWLLVFWCCWKHTYLLAYNNTNLLSERFRGRISKMNTQNRSQWTQTNVFTGSVLCSFWRLRREFIPLLFQLIESGCYFLAHGPLSIFKGQQWLVDFSLIHCISLIHTPLIPLTNL